MDDGHPQLPRYLEHFLIGGHDGAYCGMDLVVSALDRAKSVFVNEISLHVNYKKGCCCGWEDIRVWSSIGERQLG